MIRTNKKIIQMHIRLCEKNGWPYTARIINNRIIMKSEKFGERMNMETKFPMHELNFIKKVKDHIVKNKLYEKIPNRFKTEKSRQKIKYIFFNKKIVPGTEFKDCIEIDANSAFWYTLNMMGILSPEIFEKGKHVSKSTRLASVGSLAKTYRDWSYDGINPPKAGKPVKSKKTQHLWDTVCYKMGKVMAKAAKEAKDDFLFFWVDAIFIKGERATEIRDLFKKLGYNVSMYRCESIRFEKNQIVVRSKIKSKWRKEKNPVTKKRERVWSDKRPFYYMNPLSQKEVEKLNED